MAAFPILGISSSTIIVYLYYFKDLSVDYLIGGLSFQGALFLLQAIITSFHTSKHKLISKQRDQFQEELKDLQESSLILEKTRSDSLSENKRLEKELEAARNVIHQLNKSQKKMEQEHRRQYQEGAKEEVLYFLSVMQQRGRLVDFLQGDISSHPDQVVGAAARIVHQGCSTVMAEYFKIVPLEERQEGETIELAEDFNPMDYRITGKKTMTPPFAGKLRHRGWKAEKIELPEKIGQSNHTENMISPAEVFLA